VVAPAATPPDCSPVWASASVRAFPRARLAGPNQPQVQRARQKAPRSAVLVRWSSSRAG